MCIFLATGYPKVTESRSKSTKIPKIQNLDIEKSKIEKFWSVSKSESGALGWVVRVRRARWAGQGGGDKTLKIGRFSDFGYRNFGNQGISGFWSAAHFGRFGSTFSGLLSIFRGLELRAQATRF